MNKVLVNQKTFNLKSTITDDWGTKHRVAIDLEALSNVNDWKIGINLPADYKVEEIYGAEVTQEGGKTYINSAGWNKSMIKGNKAEIVLIVNEGNSKASAPIAPQFIFADTSNYVKSSSVIDSNSQIVEDWQGGYKLTLDLSAKSNVKDWQVDFNLPYKIKSAYGVDLMDKGNGNYTIKGQNDQVNLTSGQSIKPIFIIDDGGKQALKPNVTGSSALTEAQPQTSGKLSAGAVITEDWNGGYKFEVELKAASNFNNWEVDFKLPYKIKAAYGVDLLDKGSGNYTINGQNDQVNLTSGQSIKPIFIVEDGGKQALKPEFSSAVDVLTPPLNNSPGSPGTIPNSPGQPVGQRGKFNYGEALQKNFLFFEANRSGALPKDNRLEWRSDSTTQDGKDVGRDLAGGYFDAGDHIKFIQPMAFSNTMLAWGGADYKQAYAQSGQLDELMEAVKWGTDWFLKAHEMDSAGKTERLWVQVGDKNDHNYWVSPEEIASKTARPSFSIDRQRPGSDAAAGTASALASAAVLFRGTDDAYADELIKNAEALYEFAETYKGKYSDSVPQASPFYTSWSGYNDELTLGGAWLYRATGNKKYLTKAESYFKNNVGNLGDWSYATDDHSYAAATLLAKESSDPFFKQQTKNWLDTWVEGKGSVKYTSGGFAHRANWASVPLNQSAAFAAEWYNDKVEKNSKYSDFARKQVDYVLGDNPKNFSYVVGFGNNFAQRTHHRGSADTAPLDGSDRYNDHLLYGAVVGGPGKVDDFSHNDRRNDWITNEVGTSYNAPFAGTAIQQYENLGGDPLSESQLDQLIGIDANGTGF
ncbi:MAG: glycoside hydrolase family 9 protein [Waterburya sp.]